MSKQIGETVKVDGRDYVVTEVIAVGPATKAHAPQFAQRIMVQGKRGAVRLLNVFMDGTIASAI